MASIVFLLVFSGNFLIDYALLPSRPVLTVFRIVFAVKRKACLGSRTAWGS